MPTAKEALRDADDLLRGSDAIEHPHAGKELADAEELLSFVLGLEEWDEDLTLTHQELWSFKGLVARRARGAPPAYLTGRTTFRGLVIHVGPGAFVPRESSEFMAHQAVVRLRSRKHPVHLDLATGVGPVALAVASAIPRASVFGVDLYASPVRQAKDNARRLALPNATFFRGDLFRPLSPDLRGSIDVVTVHPPYVGKREMRDLPDEIVRFEPEESLTDYSRDGLGLLGRVVEEAPRWLRPGGWLLVEVSPDRSRSVATVLRRGGFDDVRSTKGPVPVSRVVLGRA